MTYYDDKRKALIDIKQLLKQDELIDDIKFYIYEKYGFGAKFVDTYIDELAKRKLIGD